MKTKKLIAKVREFLDADRVPQGGENRALRRLLHELRARQRTLRARLGEALERDEREEIEQKLKAIRAQRSKGIERLRALSGRVVERPQEDREGDGSG